MNKRVCVKLTHWEQWTNEKSVWGERMDCGVNLWMCVKHPVYVKTSSKAEATLRQNEESDYYHYLAPVLHNLWVNNFLLWFTAHREFLKNDYNNFYWNSFYFKINFKNIVQNWFLICDRFVELFYIQTNQTGFYKLINQILF